MLGRLLAAGALALTFALAAFAPARAADATIADPAAKQVETFHAALIDTMKRGHDLGMMGRYKALEPAIDAAFDFPTMMRFIVGPTWATMSDTDHKSLTDAFRRLTIANYASNFDNFNGQHFTIDSNVIQRDSDRIVQTVFVPVGDKPVPLLYRMRQSGQTWKIIDIFLEGYVSELATRRSDFSATVAAGGAAALMKKMNTLADTILAGVAKPTR
ncbi:MAG: ABC transporter substrate-binding protein [Rhizomicrobium sp.]|jgi:phospholipid transport system substrate-binding protein